LKHATNHIQQRYHTFEPTIMTAEEYQRIVDNQIVLDKKLDGIINELKVIKKDVNTAINNQQLLEQYEIDITERLKRIEKK
jgi:hypothetical protein